MDRSLILASTSSYRRALMDQLGVAYQAVAPSYEEIRDPSLGPREQLVVHARGKATCVASTHPDAVVIGSDQGLVAPDGRLLGKPHTEENAVTQLASLAGHTVDLMTAVAVVDGRDGRLLERVETTRLTFRALSEPELRAYVRADQPLDCAGSFKLESLGIVLFERVDGPDPTNVIGLPLIAVADLLQDLGVNLLLAARA